MSDGWIEGYTVNTCDEYFEMLRIHTMMIFQKCTVMLKQDYERYSQ